MRILREIRRQWIGVLGVVVGVTGVAFGATGQPAVLGSLNQANRPTVLENTAAGPAATFKTKPTAPPFAVTSAKKVPNLNAARLGGRLPSAFATAGSSYLKAESDGKYAPKTGSSAYAAAGSSYTKAESDGRYAPATGSDAYAAAGSSYLKAESDGRYAPATGSTAYESREHRVLHAATFPASTSLLHDGRKTVLSLQVTSPGGGTLTFEMFAECRALFHAFLRIHLGPEVVLEVPPGDDTFRMCHVTATTPVTAGQVVTATLSLEAMVNAEIRNGWSSLAFSPS